VTRGDSNVPGEKTEEHTTSAQSNRKLILLKVEYSQVPRVFQMEATRLYQKSCASVTSWRSLLNERGEELLLFKCPNEAWTVHG